MKAWPQHPKCDISCTPVGMGKTVNQPVRTRVRLVLQKTVNCEPCVARVEGLEEFGSWPGSVKEEQDSSRDGSHAE
jgi:hypothetical protein